MVAQLNDPRQRESEVLETLSRRVRALSIAQVARTWWPKARHGLTLAERFLVGLEARRLVHLIDVLAKPELLPTEPLATWQPGLPKPDFGPVAHQLRARRQAPAERTRCVYAAGGRPPRPTDTTHDLHLAGVYLLMRQELPTRAASWVFEEDLVRPGQKLPDALVTDGRARTAIECGGEYDRTRLEEDHAYFASQGYGYEIW